MKICNVCSIEKGDKSYYRGYSTCIKCHLLKLPPKQKTPFNSENKVISFMLMESSSDGKDSYSTGEEYYITYDKGILIVTYLKKLKPDGTNMVKWFSVHNTREIIV